MDSTHRRPTRPVARPGLARRFRIRLGTAMLLVAATAVGLSLLRAYVPAAQTRRYLVIQDPRQGCKVFVEYRPGADFEADGARLVFEGTPRNLYALDSATTSRESFLNAGDWLILEYSRLSAQDVASILTAIEAAERLKRVAYVGIRPSVDFSDLPRWCPECDDGAASPVWVVLRDGVVVWQDRGFLDADAIADRARRAFAGPPPRK